eukprot:gnl/TRDRNA2_/TRDRNA2_80839_c0_seq1.p1 gnl/TRDRNA2_/TRDRNA2_80839_c0~~gnl/TRDRNA2_/TRDRNA2_80839_c0_seq1.p1  ORF type:complete len:310 (-),score=49.79 gnl/TRDRNA2_/TRDRNA2_80839_c0_seq1:247-1068(-)
MSTVLPSIYLQAVRYFITHWPENAMPAAIALKAGGAPFFVYGHMWLCRSKGEVSRSDWCYLMGSACLMAFLTGPTGILGVGVPPMVLFLAGLFLSVSFALSMVKSPGLASLIAAIASLLLAFVGAMPRLVKHDLLPAYLAEDWRSTAPRVAICASGLFLFANALLLVYMQPTANNLLGQGAKTLASTLLFTGNVLSLEWHLPGPMSDFMLEHFGENFAKGESGYWHFGANVVFIYITAQVAQGRSLLPQRFQNAKRVTPTPKPKKGPKKEKES